MGKQTKKRTRKRTRRKISQRVKKLKSRITRKTRRTRRSRRPRRTRRKIPRGINKLKVTNNIINTSEGDPSFYKFIIFVIDTEISINTKINNYNI